MAASYVLYLAAKNKFEFQLELELEQLTSPALSFDMYDTAGYVKCVDGQSKLKDCVE